MENTVKIIEEMKYIGNTIYEYISKTASEFAKAPIPNGTKCEKVEYIDKRGATRKRYENVRQYREPTEAEYKQRYERFMSINTRRVGIICSPYDLGTSFQLSELMNPDESVVNELLRSVPSKYREGLDGFTYQVRDNGNLDWITVKFTDEYQTLFDNDKKEYLLQKQHFCDKYNCE